MRRSALAAPFILALASCASMNHSSAPHPKPVTGPPYDPAMLEAFLADLDSDDIAVRDEAAHVLLSEKSIPSWEPAARRLLAMHCDSPLSYELLSFLSTLLEWAPGAAPDGGAALSDLLRHPACFEIALRLIHSNAPYAQLLAARALSARHDRREVAAIAADLAAQLQGQRGTCPALRDRIPHLLAAINYPKTFDALLPFLKDADYSVRRSVVQALAETHDPRTIATLTDVLWNERDFIIRTDAMWGFLSFGLEGVAALRSILNDPSITPKRRSQVASLLAWVRDPQAHELLREGVRSEDPDVRRAAALGLEELEENNRSWQTGHSTR